MPAANTGLHFRIARYDISGNTLIDGARLQAAVKPYTGEQSDFGTIQQAVDAIYALYNDAGYQTVRVIIPEQAMQDGIVKLRIVESKLKRILIQGNRYHSEQNILNSLPDARIDTVPNSDAVGEDLRLANESYSKQTQLTFRTTATEGEAEGVAHVVDRPASRYAALLDNTGNDATGHYRLGLIYQNGNVLDRDQQLTLMYQTSPDHLSKVSIVNAQYRIPIYSWASYLDLGAGYSNVNSGVISTSAGDYSVSGSGNNYSLHLTRLLPRMGNADQRINLGLDRRIFRNNVTLAGNSTQLVPGITLNPWSAAYQLGNESGGLGWDFGLTYVKNLPSGSNGDAAAFAQTGQRIGANPNYSLWRYSLQYTGRYFGQWQLHLEMDGQYTRDALVAGEQFGAGGMQSVRGFDERELSNDRGNRASLEIHTPDWGGLNESSLLAGTHGLWFLDGASLSRNQAQPGELTSSSIMSSGVGLRTLLGRQGLFRLDAADVLNGSATRPQGKWKLHAGISYLF